MALVLPLHRAIRTALLSTIWNLSYYTTTAPRPNRDASSLGWGWMLSLTWRYNWTRGGPNSEREGASPSNFHCVWGSKALVPQNASWELQHFGGHHYVWARPGPLYILCLEHPRQMLLSRESNPGPPALQANTLCKEPIWVYSTGLGTGLGGWNGPTNHCICVSGRWGSEQWEPNFQIFLCAQQQ